MEVKPGRILAIPSDFLPKLEQSGISLDDLVLYINSSCNLRCTHCYLGNELLSQANVLSAESIIALLSQIKSLSRITILGGEPAMHPEFLSIIAYISRLRIDQKRITTNLTALSSFLEAGLFLKTFTISVSIDGATSRLHDKVRGHGSFDKTITNICKLRDLQCNLEVTHTLMRSNIGFFEELLELCRSLGISFVNLHRMSLHGNAIANSGEQITPDEWVEFTNQLESRSKRHSGAGISVRYPPLFTTVENYQRLVMEGLYREHCKGSYYSHTNGQRIVIYPDGKVYISSEAFGTESFIASFDSGNLVFNPDPKSELWIGRTDDIHSNIVPVINPLLAGSRKYPIVLSVSYKERVVV